MAGAASRDRLQPALLDRLIDDAPHARSESTDARVIGRAQLREIVLRDLRWLFNAMQGLGPDDAADPHVRRSTVNYGMPSLAGKLASKVELYDVERMMRQAIVDFEPRIDPSSVQVRAVPPKDPLDTHNQLELEIRGRLWAQPYPMELLLKTALDLEDGTTIVEDAAATSRSVARET
ncbi:MAG: type VI secretion system baseplate subunit TssE [Burkholderiales bacterium]|nr:MAG: type VI secretion system baseplate subunit TssE [Burkholderiales bacterium]